MTEAPQERNRCPQRTSLHFHIVFSTKNRAELITVELRNDLYGYIGGIVKSRGGVALAIGGTDDHIHILIGLTVSHRLDHFMCGLKASLSGWVRRERERDFAWQNGYGAFAVSASNIDKVRHYIQNRA